MTTITPEIVKKIADLSRLELKASEVTNATEKLAGILDNFSEIQNIDTSSTPPADDISGRKNITRPDKAKPEALATHQALLDNVPETEDNQIKVQAVF